MNFMGTIGPLIIGAILDKFSDRKIGYNFVFFLYMRLLGMFGYARTNNNSIDFIDTVKKSYET